MIYIAHFQVPLTKRAKKKFFRLIRKIPFVQNKIADEMVKMKGSFEKELLSASDHMDDFNHVPEKGKTRDEIVELTKTYLGLGEFDWREGALLTYVFSSVVDKNG